MYYCVICSRNKLRSRPAQMSPPTNAVLLCMFVNTGMAGEAQWWQSTTWGKGTAYTFGHEALSGLATVLGTPGIQLTVLSLSHVDFGDTGIQLLCQGLGRYS